MNQIHAPMSTMALALVSLLSIAILLHSCTHEAKEIRAKPIQVEDSPTDSFNVISIAEADTFIEDHGYLEGETTFSIQLHLPSHDFDEGPDWIIFYKLDQSSFDRFYGWHSELDLVGAFDRFTFYPEEVYDEHSTPYRQVSGWAHSLRISNLNSSGFDFEIETYVAPSSCSLSGHADFETFDMAVVSSFGRDDDSDHVSTYVEAEDECIIIFRFFANGVLLLHRGMACSYFCGCTADLGNWYLIVDE